MNVHKVGDANPELVHFVQGDLQHPLLGHDCFDLIHSAGVLHHTPDTARTFHRLCRALTADGRGFEARGRRGASTPGQTPPPT